MTIGQRIRQRRLSLGFTLDEVKSLMNIEGAVISKAALSKYELDRSIPKATTLYHLSSVLKVSSEYFLKQPEFEINWIVFRKTRKLTQKEENRIKSIAKEQVEALLFFSDIIESQQEQCILPQFSVASFDEVENTAEILREMWEINNWPIDSITSLLEEKSIFIVDVKSECGFDGLSGKINDKLPVIISIENNSIDRKRLSICHELGHLVLETQIIDEEKAAFRFAAAFLMPRKILTAVIGNSRKQIDIRELILLKEEYGISIQALVRRCFDLKIISEYEYKRLNICLRTSGMHLKEPGICYNKESPTKMKSKLLRAITEKLTTESEVLSRFPYLSIEFEGNRKMNIEKDFYSNEELESYAAMIANEYKADGALSGFELYEDILENE